MTFLFWASVVIICYAYIGYVLVLQLLVLIFKKSKRVRKNETYSLPNVSIIIAAFNEERSIQERIENILAQEYPQDKMEIIIASDGSEDNTVAIARSIMVDNVKVLDFQENRGRALLQNDGVQAASGEIIMFSDAETRFDSKYVRNTVQYFDQPDIGCVVGNLIYISDGKSFGADEGLYFTFEKKLRELEAELGILAKASGACMSVRKFLWRNLVPTDDSDFTTPLDVLLQGYKVAYAKDAIAYDVPPSTLRNKMKTRIRQSCKCFYGVLRKWRVGELFKHPFISWGLVSHRVVRYLTPFFMIIAFVSNICIAKYSALYSIAMAFQVLFYGSAMIGFAGYYFNVRLPVISTIMSFVVANCAILLGVCKAFSGDVYTSYKPLRK